MDLPDVCIRALSSPADEVLDALYPGQQPFLFVAHARDGGPDPLASVRVFTHERGHLHYVGHGLRDAGFCFELTFRLAGAPPAPSWPVRLMNEFARHATKAQRPFGPGHYLCLPEAVDPAGRVRCGALVPDPELTCEGEPAWLQIVDLADDELAVISEQGYDGFVSAFAGRAPLFVTRA